MNSHNPIMAMFHSLSTRHNKYPIRDSDLLGMGGEGEYFLLLSQSDAAGDAIVLKRLESLGLDCRLVQWKDREVLLKR